MFRKHTLSLYLYTRYAPQVAIANPRKMTQTAVQADLTSVALLPAQEAYQNKNGRIKVNQ